MHKAFFKAQFEGMLFLPTKSKCVVLDVGPGTLYLEGMAGTRRSQENTKKGCHDDDKELHGSLGTRRVECLKCEQSI